MAPVVSDGRVETEVAYVDSFGNLRLGVPEAGLVEALGPLAEKSTLTVTIGEQSLTARLAQTFGQVAVGATLVYVDSSGDIALAESQGNLAARTRAVIGTPVSIQRH